MKADIICSGFGGQGALTFGKFLALAGMKDGKNVSWLPSYGPEMRGGTANVAVVIADEPVASPLVTKMDVLVALNQPSLDKFGPSVRPGGLIIANEDMCPRGIEKDDVRIVNVPMSKIATEIGNQKVLNMVAIGTLLANIDLVKYETVIAELEATLGKKRPDLLELNETAIKKGMEYKA